MFFWAKRVAITWVVGVLVAPALAGPNDDAGSGEPATVAKALVLALSQDNFSAAAKPFDAAMQKALPVDKLETTWKGVLGQVGRFQKQTAIRQEKVNQFTVVIVTCQFEKAALDVRVAFNQDKQVGGLFFVPARLPEYRPPTYVRRDAFQEIEVKIGSGEWVLPGTLTRPTGDGPFPAVVLPPRPGRDHRSQPALPRPCLGPGLARHRRSALRESHQGTRRQAGQTQRNHREGGSHR